MTSINDLGEYDTKGVVAVDMESAAVAQVCYLFSTDFIIIRSVSDNFSGDEYYFNEKSASEKSFSIASKFIDNYKK